MNKKELIPGHYYSFSFGSHLCFMKYLYQSETTLSRHIFQPLNNFYLYWESCQTERCSSFKHGLCPPGKKYCRSEFRNLKEVTLEEVLLATL